MKAGRKTKMGVKMKRIKNGNYRSDNGFWIVKDNYSFSRTYWVISHDDYNVLQRYLDCGYDQCFHSLKHAKDYIRDITVSSLGNE